ncbi:MAG: hypothetical protein QXE45_02450 [Thermoplasmata archaeon]
MAEKEKDIRQEMFIRQFYSLGTLSDDERYISDIEKFLERSLKASGQINVILTEVARLIHKISAFREIAIGLKDDDGLFRYHEMLGFRKEAVDARKKIVYNNHDMADGVSYRAIRGGRYSNFHLSEFEPFKPGEEDTYNRPELLGQPRANHDDMIEGDFLDIYIYGRQKEILGWLELSGTKHGKFPTRQDLLNLEFIASCLALLLSISKKKTRMQQY